jgi:hypothetical protein
MRTIMCSVAVAAALVAVVASPAAAKAGSAGTPQRPQGEVITSWTSVNGGSNGWGNCGHNASGGTKTTGYLADGTTASPNKGLGGYDKSGCPLPATAAVVDPVTGTTITGTTAVVVTEAVPAPEAVIHSDPVFYSDSYGYDAV